MNYGPYAARALDYFGIEHRRREIPDAGLCDACHNHLHSRRMTRPLCLLELARREEMRALGIESRACLHCRQFSPVLRGAICPACRRRSEQVETRRSRRRSPSHVRVDDGHGCVERVHPTELLISSTDRGQDGLR